MSYVQKLSHLLIKVDQREFEQFCNCREIKWNISQLETVSQFHATQIAKCIFTNCTIFFYQNCKIISSKVKNVFAQITKCICLNCISVTARRSNGIFCDFDCFSISRNANCKIYFFKLENIFLTF